MDQDLPQHIPTNDENESNSFDHALENEVDKVVDVKESFEIGETPSPKTDTVEPANSTANDSLDQLFQKIEDAYARPYHTTHDIIRKQLQANAIRGVLHKPSCSGDAGEPFESEPQIKQTKAEVHYVRHWGEPESEEGDDIESESNSDSKIDNSESQPEPQIKQTKAEERHNLIQNWGKGDWRSDDSNVEFEWENTESEDDLESNKGDSESKGADSKSNGTDSEPSRKATETKPTKNSLNASMHNDLANDKFIANCKSCNLSVEFWHHCIQCKDFDLCTVCYSQEGHPHHMEPVDLYQNFEQKLQQHKLNQEQSWDKSQAEFLSGTDGALISYWQKRMGLSYNIIVAEKSRFVTNLFRDEFATTQNGNHLVSMKGYGKQCVYELLQIVGGPEMSAFDKSELKEILDQLPENARFVCARSKAIGNDIDPEVESALISKWQRKMGRSYNIIVAPKSRFTTSSPGAKLSKTQNDHHFISMMDFGEQRIYELLQIVGGPEILDFSKSKVEEILQQMPGDAKFICGCPKPSEKVLETEPEPETASVFFSKWQRNMGPSYTKVIDTF